MNKQIHIAFITQKLKEQFQCLKEGKFSSVKRKFGETIRATKLRNMLREAKRKFLVYETMRQYAKA